MSRNEQTPISGFRYRKYLNTLFQLANLDVTIGNEIYFVKLSNPNYSLDGVALHYESSVEYPPLDCNKIALCWSSSLFDVVNLSRTGLVRYSNFYSNDFLQQAFTPDTKAGFARAPISDYITQAGFFADSYNNVTACAIAFKGQIPGIGLIDLDSGMFIEEDYIPVVRIYNNTKRAEQVLNLNVVFGLYPSSGDRNITLSQLGSKFTNSIDKFIEKNGYGETQVKMRVPPALFRFEYGGKWVKSVHASRIAMADVRGVVSDETKEDFLSEPNVGSLGIPLPTGNGGTVDGYYYSPSGLMVSDIEPSVLSIYKVAKFTEDDVYEIGNPDSIISSIVSDTGPVDPYTPPSGGDGGGGIPSSPGGGDGSFPSDPGPSLVDQIPDGQTGNDIAKSGLFTMYLMNQGYMDLMGEILWEDNIGIQALKEIFGNPINSIINTISYPFDLLNLVDRTNGKLYFGPWKTDLDFQVITRSSFQIDWGNVSIPFAWGNFLDYSPYTKMELFLPWGPGYVQIDPNDVSPHSNTPGNFDVATFANGSIGIKTNIELGKGTCVHTVIGNNGRIIGVYSGIVGKQVPITALDTGGKVLSTIAAVSAVVGGTAVGSLAAKGAMDSGRLTGTPMRDPMRPFESKSYWDTGMISGRSSAQSLLNSSANMASRAINSTPITFPRAGTFSDGSSALTPQIPFLIISRPVQSVPEQYGHYNGYPSNIHYGNLNDLSGYTEISEIHLDNVTATADELSELDSILKGGILL